MEDPSIERVDEGRRESFVKGLNFFFTLRLDLVRVGGSVDFNQTPPPSSIDIERQTERRTPPSVCLDVWVFYHRHTKSVTDKRKRERRKKERSKERKEDRKKESKS